MEKKLLLFLQRTLNIKIPTHTLVLLKNTVKNCKQLLVRLQSNVLRCLVDKYFQMKTMKYFYNRKNFV